MVAFNKTIELLKDCEQLNSSDYLFLTESDENLCNITCLLTMEGPIDVSVLKRHIFETTKDINRFRHKLVSYFGNWYFQKMTLEEWEENKKTFVTVSEEVNTHEQVVDLMTQLHNYRDPLDRV